MPVFLLTSGDILGNIKVLPFDYYCIVKGSWRKGLCMDMNKAFFLKKEAVTPRWRLIDAEGKILGRLATQIADMLRGKNNAYYTPHTDGGDYIVVINAEKVVLSGNKFEDKYYDKYTGWMGGYKVFSARELLAKKPEKLVEFAVKGMLPNNNLNRLGLKKLKVYAGAEHPHKAQNPEKV